jgi:hypothetical protein
MLYTTPEVFELQERAWQLQAGGQRFFTPVATIALPRNRRARHGESQQGCWAKIIPKRGLKPVSTPRFWIV